MRDTDRNPHNDAIDGSALLAELYREAIRYHEQQAANFRLALGAVEPVKALPPIPADDFRPPKERGREAFSSLLKRLPSLTWSGGKDAGTGGAGGGEGVKTESENG